MGDKGKIDLDFDGQLYSIQYEVFNFVDGWFDLIIWYKGKSISERVPAYTVEPFNDIEAAHGPILLKKLLENDE